MAKPLALNELAAKTLLTSHPPQSAGVNFDRRLSRLTRTACLNDLLTHALELNCLKN